MLSKASSPLGVLHVERTRWQKPFTEEDLQLAEALTAHISAGIEAYALLRDQREMLVNRISVLAKSAEEKQE
jgi:GAF domain-containing protein